MRLRSGLNFAAALGAGDDDPALAHGDAADGAAGLAGEILVVLVRMALPGAEDLLFTRHHQFRNFWFSSRRFPRFRENMRKSMVKHSSVVTQ